MILGLFPELLSNGGIQRISQNICAVLQEFADNRGQVCNIFSLNDPKGFHELEVAGRRYKVRGFGKNKLRFVLTIFAVSFKSRLFYIAHPNFALLGLLFKLLNPHARYIVAAYGVDVWNPLPLLCRLGLRYAHALTAISNFTAQKMVEIQGVEPNQIEVIPCIIDDSLLKANGNKSQLNSKHHDQRILLTVGRLVACERLKGIDEVILALPKVTKLISNTVYVVVGEGDDRGRLEELVKKNNLSSHVVFTGTVSDEKLVELYQGCDVFLMPSRQEGFGIVFLEAMAFKKPVIGGNHGGTPEVIVDNETGFLVEHGDVNTLADHIIRLLSDQELSERMGNAGCLRVKNHYTFEPLRHKLMSFLAQVEAS